MWRLRPRLLRGLGKKKSFFDRQKGLVGQGSGLSPLPLPIGSRMLGGLTSRFCKLDHSQLPAILPLGRIAKRQLLGQTLGLPSLFASLALRRN